MTSWILGPLPTINKRERSPICWGLARVILLVFLGLNTATANGVQAPFDPAYATIERLRAALDARETTSVALVKYYLRRIERLDQNGPHINALISVNPNALDTATRLDAAAADLHVRSPLYGIPFVVKDNFDTSDLATTGGSAALRNSHPKSNSFVVQRLLDQGAILIGKANMSELAASYGRFGYSSAGGQTLNPFNTARDVSGSSSGSAAAVAADLAAFALGTDTAGSVRSPASVAALVGLRPTLGLLSRAGVIPCSLTFDTPGILARSARDAAIVLNAVAGPDPEDAATWQSSPLPPLRSTVANMGKTSLVGVRLGVVANFRGGNAEVDAIEAQTLRKLRAHGALVVPLTLPSAFEKIYEEVLAPIGEAEFKPEFERYLRSLAPQQPQTLGALIDISESDAVARSPHPVNPARLTALRQADVTALTDSPLTIRILTHTIPELREQLRALMQARHLDALVFATMSCPASPRFDRTDPSYHCASADPYRAGYVASAVGFPEVSIPVGRAAGNIPVGLSMLGKPAEEARLLALADAVERRLSRPSPPNLN